VANEMNDVVVADDNSLLLSVLSEILKECGCTVRAASDGFEALVMILDRVPDILISELLPASNGALLHLQYGYLARQSTKAIFQPWQ
jgi:CheY-like chemotaxis protein